MTVVHRTARERAREEITHEITDVARRQLARVGPSELSLRAVAREVGMVSSAVYRYFPSRDDLLTALLIEAYDELGEAAESADRAVRVRTRFAQRFQSVARAIRGWAIDHPHDYALLYGTPVHGYVAPTTTVGPATRVTLALVTVVADAYVTGPLAGTEPVRVPRPLHSSIAGAAAITADLFETRPDDDTVVRVLMAWTTIFGAVSFELFGHYANSVTDFAAYFDGVVARLVRDLGLP